MKCESEKLQKLLKFIPSTSVVELPEMPFLNKATSTKIINAGIIGVVPSLIGLIILIAVIAIYFSRGKTKNQIKLWEKIILIIMFVVVGLMYIASGSFVVGINQSFKKIQKDYVELVKEMHSMILNMKEVMDSFPAITNEITRNATALKSTNDYYAIESTIHEDFLNEYVTQLRDNGNPLESVNIITKYDLMKYEAARKSLGSYFSFYVNFLIWIIFFLVVCTSVLVMFISTGFTTSNKFWYYLHLLLTLILLIMSVFTIAIPQVLTVICQNFSPIVQNVGLESNISIISSILMCDPTKPDKMFRSLQQSNMSLLVPKVPLDCTIFNGKSVKKACYRLISKLDKFWFGIVKNYESIQKKILKNVESLFACNKIPSKIKSIKCSLCTDFAEKTMVTGILSISASMLFLVCSIGFQRTLKYKWEKKLLDQTKFID